MTVLSCSNYHIFLKALVYKEGHHASIKGRRYVQKKLLLLQVRDLRQMICKFHVLLREADAHINHRT